MAPNCAAATETPALAGDTFLAKWRNHSVDELFERIRVSMPADRPGTLSRQKNADILAYIFAANQVPGRRRELEYCKARRSNRSGSSHVLLPDRHRKPCPPAPHLSLRQQRSNNGSWAAPAMVEGQPIERRPPEKSDNQPAFPEQTRAPYHATAPFKVTTLIDNMPAPWSLAFLPSGKILLTHRLPGSLRILDTNGMLSEPVAGVAGLGLSRRQGHWRPRRNAGPAFCD